MRAPIRWAVQLYPPDWRNRYGVEFGALLEDVGPGWSDFWDVVRGGLAMRIETLWSFRKVAAVCGLAGALVAAVVAFQIDNQYLSTTILRVSSASGTTADGHAVEEQVQKLQEELLSRHSLVDIIQQPEFDLYHSQRQRVPLEDIVQTMRTHDIQIRLVQAHRGQGGERAHDSKIVPVRVYRRLPGEGAHDFQTMLLPVQLYREGPGATFALTFSNANAAKAQAVTRALAARMMELNRSGTAFNLEVLDPANFPQKPVYPIRLASVILGLLGGLAAGVIIMAFRRRPTVTVA
jgi:hypothetical protein